MDERFRKINRLLSLYSLGKFDNKIELSPRLDEIDAFIAGVNMLGEELKAITISRNYFTNIFNSVSDMVFILDKKGFIEHINNAAANQLEYAPESLTNVFVDELQIPSKRPLYDVLTKELKKEKQGIRKDTTFLTASGKAIPVRITAAPLVDPSKKKSGILLTARDITHELKTEKLVIRAIIDTQEKEQRRLAQD
ncbi:MAG TPA: PAS domain-containing protein, partial [Flavisolibacter sp.]|nr:PAS domain-containing protein [Flavisolibacter sp.]